MRISDWSSDVCSSDLVYALIILFWGKVYPAILHDVYQVKPLAGGKPSNLALRLKILIFSRLGSDLLPLLNLSRFMAWNNVLLLPLAALGVLQLRWRTMFARRSEEHTSELQSLMRISYAV